MKGGIMLVESSPIHRVKFCAFLHYDTASLHPTDHHDDENDNDNSSQHRSSYASPSTTSPRYFPDSSSNASPYLMSPLNSQVTSPFNKSPWLLPSTPINLYREDNFFVENGLVGSLIRKEGHVYSLAVSGDLLYTGSDSKNIRVWKNLKDFTGFKSSSGLVKAIVISGEKIFTGHQDGKIRVWKASQKDPSNHIRVGSLPTFRDYVKCSMNPKNYVEVRRHRNAVKIRHYDAVSSLSLDEENGLLYSVSWDKTLKVWSVSDSKCLESINAHRDAVNAVVAGFGCCAFTGSADGTVKMWRREMKESKGKKKTKHVLERVLLEQESAVTALVVNRWSTVVYGGSSDGLVNFWVRGKKNSTVSYGGVLRGHELAVLCLAVAGNLVLSGSADKNACVWKREESGVHTWLSVLTGHTGPVKCIAAIGEGEVNEHDQHEAHELLQKYGKGDQRWIAYTGSLDKSVKVWRVSGNAPELRMIQGWAPRRDLSSGEVMSFSSPRRN